MQEMRAGGQTIRLQNPVADHFPGFIFGNATHCDAVVPMGDAAGKHVVICGAGPTLADHAAAWCPGADEVWGCNSALNYLTANGHRVTHGITVDQTPQMVEEWQAAPDVDYLLASTVHPHLTEYLLAQGRRLRFFHNYVGIKEKPVIHEGRAIDFENWLYCTLYPPTVVAGAGLNTVTRAIDVALFRGFARITVLGADCALRATAPLPDGVAQFSPEHLEWLKTSVVMHADGGHALRSGATATTIEGEIDGRHWLTKPDMMISATFLTQMAWAYPERITLIGDTLPVALLGKDQAFLDRLPHLSDSSGRPVRYTKTDL